MRWKGMVMMMTENNEEINAREWEKQFQTAKKDIEIHFARYGPEAEKRDVITYIQSRISSADRLNLFVNNDNLGGDHYPGKAKELRIAYTFNGVLYEELLDEGEMLVIPKLTEAQAEFNGVLFLVKPLLDNIGAGLVILALAYGISLIVKVFKNDS